jgi:hypothetical protein
MDTLPHRHLMTLTLDVDFRNVTPIGDIDSGRRGIAPVLGGRFEGERLNGTVRPGWDWFVARPGGLSIDVRLTLDADDGPAIYLSYTGQMVAPDEAMARFRAGQKLAPDEYRTTTVARFECGAPRYRWLNDALVVGVGDQLLTGVCYTLFEIAPFEIAP